MSNEKEIPATSVSLTTERDCTFGEPSNEVVDVIDRLSISPCLLTILKYTTHADILNYKRISRGMNEFIQRNERSLPKMKAIVSIGCSHRKDHRRQMTAIEADGVAVLVELKHNGRNKTLTFLLGDTIINMGVKNAPFVKKHFNIDDSPNNLFPVMRPITSLADGLGTLFSLFLPRITLSELKLENSPLAFLPEECVSAIVEQFKIARSRCSLFDSEVPPFPGMARLYTQLGCAEVRLCYTSFKWECGFPLLDGFDRKISITLYSGNRGEDIEAMERVITLINEWSSTEKRIKFLTAAPVMHVSCGKLAAAIRSIPHDSVEYFDDHKVRITLRKEKNANIQLRVEYCERSKYLSIHDIEVDQPGTAKRRKIE